MRSYDFALAFALPSECPDPDDCVDRLGACGCDDAVVGIGTKGRIGLRFTREADSAREAVLSAITDVRCALPDADLIEAAPDFVGLSDIAETLSVSRQNARKLLVDCRQPGPLPVHEGHPTLWRLAKVLQWLESEKGYTVDDCLVELSTTIMQVNLAVTNRDADAAQQEQILARLR